LVLDPPIPMGSSVLLVILGLKVGLVPLARGAKILIPSIVSAEALTELRGPWINRGIMFWEFWHSRKSANGRRKKKKRKKKEKRRVVGGLGGGSGGVGLQEKGEGKGKKSTLRATVFFF